MPLRYDHWEICENWLRKRLLNSEICFNVTIFEKFARIDCKNTTKLGLFFTIYLLFFRVYRNVKAPGPVAKKLAKQNVTNTLVGPLSLRYFARKRKVEKIKKLSEKFIFAQNLTVINSHSFRFLLLMYQLRRMVNLYKNGTAWSFTGNIRFEFTG